MKKINDVFGFVKTHIDAHTMGIYTMANLLRDCGYSVFIASESVCVAVENLKQINNYSLFKHWIESNNINRIGFSYRMDPSDGCDYFMTMFELLKTDKMFLDDGGQIKDISFAGLPETCKRIKQKTNNQVLLFPGNESPVLSLRKYGISEESIPQALSVQSSYDKMRWDFAKKIIASEQWKLESSQDHYGYSECGEYNDSYVTRMKYASKKHTLPLIRTHCGPYNSNRMEALKEFNSWCKNLSQSQLLDILSIGSSQLTQSNFGEDWKGMSNGGGVPINSALEYSIIKENAKPMLVRTYSGTKNVQTMARIHEKYLNICWHAFSFWWFDELDGRGENTLIDNLREHFDAIHYVATTDKPVEPNVPHHFAFRGCDDITYIVSGFLASKAIKLLGVKHLVLQNMLNTPKYTSGERDLAKGRCLLTLVKELEDDNFKVSLQTRGGLDYFSPDLEQAEIQLAAITCLMDDLEPENENSPEIIHVVNYSEAVYLATPQVIKESIQITLATLHKYRKAKRAGIIPNMKYDNKVREYYEAMMYEARIAINLLEKYIPNLYSPEGFEMVFKEGFLTVPYLLDQEHRWTKATMWKTAIKDGGVNVVDDDGNIISTEDRYHKIISNMEYC